MGFLEKLKAIFSRQEEARPHGKGSFAVSELEGWFEEKVKDVIEENNDEMKEICEEIEANIKKTKEKTALLEEAELRNKNIPEKAKQVLSGNKAEYLKKISRFLEHAKPPVEIERETIKRYCNEFNNAIEFLHKSTVKQALVLKEFHEHEAYQVNLAVKAIEDDVIELNEVIDGEDFKKIDSIKEYIAELNKIEKTKKGMKEEFEAQEKEIESSKAMIADIEKESAGVSQTKEYIDMQKARQKKEKLNNEMSRITTMLSDKFSNLRKALEKFKRGRLDKKLIDKYLEDPLASLLDDEKLKIISAIEKLEKSIEAGQIELKENIKRKALDACKETTKEELEEYAKRHKEIINEIKMLDRRIEESTAVKMKSDLDSKHDFLNEKIAKLKEKNNALKENISKIKSDSTEQEIKKEVKELLNFELDIKEGKEEEKEKEN